MASFMLLYMCPRATLCPHATRYARSIRGGEGGQGSFMGRGETAAGGPGTDFTCFTGTKEQILTPAELVQRAEQVEQEFGMDCVYEEDDASDIVSFTRSGVVGTLQVSESRFELDARLGFLLGAFKDRIESEIVKNLDQLLKPKTAAKTAAKTATKVPAKAATKVAGKTATKAPVKVTEKAAEKTAPKKKAAKKSST